MTKISDLSALTGAGVDPATDLIPIVDMSEAGATRNKKITPDEVKVALDLDTSASPQFTALNLGHASDTTLTRVSAGVVAIEGVNIVTTAGGVTFAADIVVPDEAYDATAWNGSLEVPTKNAVRDKIESLAGGVTTLDGLTDVNAPTPSNNDVLTWDSTPGEWVAAAPGSVSLTLASTVTQSGTPVATSVGFLGAPQMADQDDYTLALTDSGGHYYHVSGTPHTLTIPANASVAFPIGTVIGIVNENGAGALTIAITSDTLRWGSSTGSRTLAANGSATLLKVTSTVWRLTGDGIT